MDMKNYLDEVQEQDVIMHNRKSLDITGVKKIESLNPLEFVIITVLGKMVVRGNDLEMQALDIDNGKLSILGSIRYLEYLDKDKSVKGKEKGFVSKLFK